MNTLLKRIETHVPSDVFTDTTLCHLIKGTHDKRYGLVKRAIKAGDIIHLCRGLYVLAKKHQRHPANLYKIAQSIYGPSYVSFESALSYHGWIPEAVYTVTSACSKRSKEVHTPLGLFSYAPIPSNKFFAGVQRVSSPDGVFLMATPWRALVDYVYIHKKNWKDLKTVIENLRVDESRFRNADFRLLENLYQAARSARVKRFINGIRKELLV